MKTEKYFIACNKQTGTVTFGKAKANFDEFDTFYTKIFGRIPFCYKEHCEYFFIDKLVDACWLMGELKERGILQFNNCEWIYNFVEIAERKEASNMLAQKEYYEIFIYNNEIAVVEKIDDDIYNYFKDTFESVYHTKNGNTYHLHENFDAFINMLIVDNEEHLYELLDDLREQGFCDTIEFKF